MKTVIIKPHHFMDIFKLYCTGIEEFVPDQKMGHDFYAIANAIINDLGVRHRFLNATVNTKKDLDIVIEEAKMYDGLVLVMDEIHRLNKDKQDILLPCLESGLITLIGMTTSNPFN